MTDLYLTTMARVHSKPHYRLPAKSMSWRPVDQSNPLSPCVLSYNGREVKGEIEYDPGTLSWDAHVEIKLRATDTGSVYLITATVLGCSSPKAAGNNLVEQWFRLAADAGWHSY
jgi:hypothetical protein